MGPAVESPEKVRELIAAGMNMARLNLSHGGYDEHQNRLDQVRAAAAETGKPVAILVDLQGPKIRLARFKAGPYDLARGDIFTITATNSGAYFYKNIIVRYDIILIYNKLQIIY